jgi:type II secretion system protein J
MKLSTLGFDSCERTTSFRGPRLSFLHRSRSVAGFTLIEVLVATLLFGLVLASLYGTWRVVLTSTDAALRITARSQRARMASVTIDQALTSAQLFQANGSLYSFICDTSGHFAELSFVSTLGDSFPGSGVFGEERVRRVSFLVSPGANGGNDLVMYQNSLLDLPEQTKPYEIILAHDITAFQLEFWDRRKGEYVPEWLFTNQLPQIVRVTLGLGSDGRYSRKSLEIVSRVVIVPAVSIPPFLQIGGGPG